jgi:hypothetical protein
MRNGPETFAAFVFEVCELAGVAAASFAVDSSELPQPATATPTAARSATAVANRFGPRLGGE